MANILGGDWLSRRGFRLVLLALCVLLPCDASAQLRIVTYNTTGAINSNLEIVLRSIGEEIRNGFAKPIDVLLLQEQNSPSSDTQTFVNYLNTVYGPGTYARGSLSGLPVTSAIRQTIVYNTQSVDLVAEARFGDAGGTSSQQPRQTMRYQLRPDGYDSSADFYVYNSHYKASQGTTEANRRNVEALSIRGDATYGSDALGEGAHVIYAGDHNFYDFDADEPAWGTLTAAGPGQAIDPINRVGTWHVNSSFADVHTQAPCVTGCGAGGGMDDRFDFQLVTGEFLDGAGLDVIAGSYHAFGNNGTTYNTDINSASNTYAFEGVTTYTRSQVLNALHDGTDHLPVLADYQLPAMMDVATGTVPLTLDQGTVFNLDVTVTNIADVLAAIGADVLDYSLSASGHLAASFLDQMDMALGGGNLHYVSFDTSTPGMKSGMITVSSTSQSVQNGLVEIPIQFEVLASGDLPGDYNEDEVVDAADYTTWRDHLGSSMALPNDDTAGVSQDDFDRWKMHFGSTAGGSTAAVSVPEPGSALMLFVGNCLALLVGGKAKSWSAINALKNQRAAPLAGCHVRPATEFAVLRSRDGLCAAVGEVEERPAAVLQPAASFSQQYAAWTPLWEPSTQHVPQIDWGLLDTNLSDISPGVHHSFTPAGYYDAPNGVGDVQCGKPVSEATLQCV
jgi:hypothetical protein